MIDNGGVTCVAQTTCLRCGTEGRMLHSALSDKLFGVPGTWSMRRCPAAACGLAWLDPQPLSAEISKFYQSYYTHTSGAGNRFLDVHSSSLKRLIKALLARLLFWRRPLFRSDLFFLEGLIPGRVLDVGCGSGDFLVAAARNGWRAVGIDFDANAVAAANANEGVEAQVGELIACGFEEGSFDAVVLNNVIEHLPNTSAVFAECRRILRPGGRLVMMTPNLDAIGHEIYGADWRGLEPPRHLIMFTPALLARYAEEQGFAHVSAFTYAAGVAQASNILSASADLARLAGRTPPSADHRAIERREKLLELIGQQRGEFAMLVAHR